MADIKISEMGELLPFDDLTQTGGVNGEDVLTILDVSESDLTKINKKIKFSTLIEAYAPLNSPNFTGNPTVPTPNLQVTPVNSRYVVNITWVQQKLDQLKLSDLDDTNINELSPFEAPEDGDSLVYNSTNGKWTPGRVGPTTERATLQEDRTLSSDDSTYLFFGSNQEQINIILPSGQADLRFVIKNIRPFDTTLNIKIGTSGSETIATIDHNTPVGEFIHDGTEWHAMLF